LRDVIGDLAQRSSGRHGEIDVRILTMPDGSRRVIVDVTGTKSWDPLPTRDITSLTTNGRALVGERTAYEEGVLAAMRAAGVQRSDRVMMVGHSEGGMVAVTAARDATASGEFDVTHVITAGAPIGRTVGSLPARVKVLALENTTDVVPHLDGVANPDKPNVTTVSGQRGNNTVGGDHDIARSYVPLAGDAQASHHRSVREFLHSAGGYFGATQVETRTYQIQRRTR
jgi:pimeloyl-ACP methyl ester carboxylesterase